LAHELTHVAQYEGGAITGNSDKKELEDEAEQRDVYDRDSQMTIEVNGRYFSFPRSKMKEYAAYVAEGLDRWVEEQKYRMGEKEYLDLLCTYSDWLEHNR
jgi:predicted metal-dependent HD superfamily phosphohydrolase